MEAAKVRKHDGILKIARNVKEGEVPVLYYHRRCRSVFTLKRDLESLKRKVGFEEEEDEDEFVPFETPRKRSKATSSPVYAQECIFCEKVKYVNRIREKLVKASQLRVDHKLRQIAVAKCDKKILAITSRDIVAAEARYHRSCYRDYTRPQQKSHDEESVSSKANGAEYDAFTDLFRYIRNDVLDAEAVITMVDLTKKLESFIQSRGIERLSESTKKHIRRKIEAEFGSTIEIFPDEKGKLLVMPGHLSKKEVVKSKIVLEKELEKMKMKVTEIQGIVDQSAVYMRNAILDMKWATPWPILPSHVSIEQFSVPEVLYRFLMGLLTSNPVMKNPSPRVKLLVQSFSQDIIYAVTCGKTKPPKHILLSYGVKTLTGNVEIIQMLNRFGHGVSYSQLEENDTALCLQKLAANLNQTTILPGTIQPNVFTNPAWDNIDRLEETLTGKGTTHRVNGIVVQPTVYGPHLPCAELPAIMKRKQRSITHEVQPLAAYIAGERVGPKPISVGEDTNSIMKEAEKARKKNLVWLAVRITNAEDQQQIPSWTGFNIMTRSKEPVSKDVIAYLPTINAPATELTTVNEILRQSEDIRRRLSLSEIVVVMDQALYAKACEVVWKNRDLYGYILLRLGTFHIICNVLSIIGKRFQDAGLRDICIESGILAEGSVSSVIEGKMYNRAVRVHKYIYEALLRLIWKQFIPWVSANHANKVGQVREVVAKVNEMAEAVSQEQFDSILHSQSLEELYQLWDQYLQYLRADNGDLSAFWMSYLDIVEDVLLGLIRASREGNWLLHLHAIRQMIPWCFAYDKINYARYLPVYYVEMMNLPSEHPDVYGNFMAGNFAVQLAEGSPFGRVPVDQATEVTVNKDTKTSGGVTKFSLKTGAVNRFYMTAEYRCSFLAHLRDMLQVKRPSHHHDEMLSTRKVKDDKAVTSIENLIEGWNNPFKESKQLVSISTATEAPEDVTQDLMKAREIGEQAYKQFKEERLEAIQPKNKFHDPMKLKKLKTFSSLSKKRNVTAGGRTMILKADRSLFGRIIILGQNRKIEVRELLHYSLGPLPWALATPEGFPRKTNKATLATYLQKDIHLADSLPRNSTTIIDGMSLVQKLNIGGGQTTYGMVASSLLSMALHEGSQSKRIDVVFDTYRQISIKNAERTMRGEVHGVQVAHISAYQLVKQWRKFLCEVKNKTSLIKFLSEEWKTKEYSERLQGEGKVLYVTSEKECWKITSERNDQVPELSSSQEEADTRLLLHASHAAKEGYEAVVVNSEDTDVFILLLGFSNSINTKLYMRIGTRTRTRLIDIAKVVQSTGREVCEALIGLHAFTGCDTVSSFAGKGKISALKILKSNYGTYSRGFRELGQTWAVTNDLFMVLERFTCSMYMSVGNNTGRVNDARYELFCAKNGEVESHQLPPCQDCLRKHVLRANYQAG